MKKFIVWMGALVVGAVLGTLGIVWLNDFFNFLAKAYTQLFQFVALPTIALAVTTTLAGLGDRKGGGRIFAHTIFYTLATTFAATMVGLALYLLLNPGSVSIASETIKASPSNIGNYVEQAKNWTVYGHILNAIPSNIIAPFAAGNVLSILIVASALGIGLAVMPKSDNSRILISMINGLQELFFTVIRGLVCALPLGIVAFAAQLTAQLSQQGETVASIGKYLMVVLAGNGIQFFVILPLFLLCRGLNPLKVFMAMSPAVMMALFTKSSTATLPVTVSSARNNMKARSEVADFVLPICCTINMNGCAAFIYVTSLFVMQLGGVELTASTYIIWSLIAVISAVGNAGVPMGCYFLTLSLMAGQGMPLGIMGVILPFYAVIDMIETAENVWSDSCVCAIVNKETAPAKA